MKVRVEVAVRACRRRAAMTRLYTMPMRQGVSRATLLAFRQHGLDTTAAPTRPLPAEQQPHVRGKQRPASWCPAGQQHHVGRSEFICGRRMGHHTGISADG